MSSLLACNAKHGFLYLAYQHKEVTRMTFAEKLKSIVNGYSALSAETKRDCSYGQIRN